MTDAVINLDYKGKVNVNGYSELHKNNSVGRQLRKSKD